MRQPYEINQRLPKKHLMNFKLSTLIIVVSLLFFSCKKETQQSKDIVQVEYPETYELSNIILALTEYGKKDKWEVRQNFDYYNKVQEYFKPFSNHPLLDSVNYSRKKWMELLSFRSDAYAFSFDKNNQLKRDYEFYANPGVAPFDKHLDLINDFVKVTNFRSFYSQHKDYRNKMRKTYKKTQYLPEMKAFLEAEFGKQIASDKAYKVILSPFVYRMNCHREIDSLTVADFITVPDYVVSDTIEANAKNIATSIHNLFTEMDHGYVNPTTKKIDSLITQKFDENIWNDKSGYENSGNAVFNEYMTWAVYDIFLQKYFPEYTKQAGLNWSFQNDSRGFQYAQLFTQKLLELYNNKKPNQTIVDLYPAMLDWTSSIQSQLSKPTVLTPKEQMNVSFSDKTPIRITFSEAMKPVEEFSIIVQDTNGNQTVKEITASKNQLTWEKKNTEVSFILELPTTQNEYYLILNWWKTKRPLYSEKEALLKSGTYFKVSNK